MRKGSILNKFFILIICSLTFLAGRDLFAQSEEKNDYFVIGLYGGSYIGQSPLYEKNQFLNSGAIEFEYFKFSDLSFYVQGLYEFTGSDVRILFDIPNWYSVFEVKTPETFRLNLSFGGRYYLRNKKVNPFFEAGINHETNYIGPYSYKATDNQGFGVYSYDIDGYYHYRLSANLGVGLSIVLNKRFRAEMKYDLYKSLIKARDQFTGFSFLAGIKYVL